MDEGHRSAFPRKSSGEIWSSFILPCPVPMHYYRHVGQVGRGTFWVRPIGNRPSSPPLTQTAAQSPGPPASPAATAAKVGGSRALTPHVARRGIFSGSEKSGRDGQIRTADLSLRRRPLYPSELRPHS